MRRDIVLAGLVMLSLSLGACRRKQVPVAAVPMTPSTAPAIAPAVASSAGGGLAVDRAQFLRDSMERARTDSLARLASTGAAVSLRAALEAAVRFDYDAADITDDGRAVLDAKLPILRTNMAVRVRISGHTDSRGSDEYNLALGLRRAASARKYLSDRGIAVDRIDIVSFGEERPATSGDDEGAFSQNRRAEFEILSGADALRTPR
jgi:peptidoglycan-associated lipoprotein